MIIMDFENPPVKMKTTILPLLIVILMWGIFIFPSSFHPYWCYLDDPTSLLMGESLAAKFHIPKPDGITGRYFPAYYLYYALLFKFFGFNLYGYYIVQSFIFLLTMLLVYLIIAKFTKSLISGIFAAFLVITASPVAENAYTFGKAEPKILFYLLCAIYIFTFLIDKDRYRRKIFSVISWIGITLLIFIAVLTKETAFVFIIFATAGVLITFFIKKSPSKDKQDTKLYLLLLISSICSIILARGLYFALRPSNAQAVYTTYPITPELVLKNLKFYVSQQPDVIFLGLICAVLLILLYKKRGGLHVKSFIFGGALFFTGLAYVVGHLIWRWPLGYYLLIPSVFFSIAVVITLWSLGNLPNPKKIIYVSAIFLLLTRVYSIPYFYYIAHAQKTVDKTYTEAIKNYIQRAKHGERLLVEQWPFFAEQVVQSNILIKNIFDKKELQVEGVQDIVENITISPDLLRLYNVTSIPNTFLRLPKRNDYVLTLTGDRESHYSLRGVSPFLNKKESLFKAQGMELEKIMDKEISWKGLQIRFPLMVPKFKEYSAGYKLYKVKDPTSIILWEGRWTDNWISNRAKCALQVQKEKEKFLFTGFVTKHSIPTSLYVFRGDNIIKKVTLNKAGPFSFTLEIFSAKKSSLVVLELVAGKTFIPKALGINNDERNLSVQIAVQRI